jgi:outer membrane protein OmpA-like peptidoglycan-associated protein
MKQMIKRISLLPLALLASLLLPAQSIVWQYVFGGSGYDRGMKMIPTTEGCYLFGGYTGSSDGVGTGNAGAPKNDLMLLKVTAAGKLVWAKTFGGSAHDDFGNMVPTADGGAVLIGTTESNDGMVKGKHPKMDMWVIRVDRLGTVLWRKCYGGLGNDRGFAVTPTSDGGYLIGGESGSKDGDMTGSHGSLDAWVAKLDKWGNIERQQSFGGLENETVTHLIELPRNEYLVVCTSSSRDGNVKSPHGEKDVWMFTLSKNFDIIWQNNFGGSSFDDVHDVVVTPKGHIVATGTSFSNDGDLAGKANSGMGDTWVFCVSPVGKLRWSSLFGGSRSDGANALAQTPDGGFIVVGSSSSHDKQVPKLQGYYDGWVVRMDSVGKYVWSTSFGGEEFDHLYDVMPVEDGHYLAVGSTESTKGDVLPLGKTKGDDVWFVEFTDPEPGPDKTIDSKPYMAGYITHAQTKKPVLAEIILYDNDALKEIARIKCDTASGGIYYLPIDPAKVKNGKGHFSVSVAAKGYMVHGRDIDLSGILENPEVRVDAELVPVEIGTTVALRHIYFDSGKWDLKPASNAEMERLMMFMKNNPSVKIEIGGHTDDTGDAKSKKELSLKRANSVRDYMLRAGMTGHRMSTEGYGMYYPVAPNDTEENRALNRRVEVKVTSK